MPTQIETIRRGRSIWIVLIFALVSHASVGQTGRIETLPALKDSAVPAGVCQLLEPKGFRIFPDANSPALEIWYRKEIPAQPKPTTSEAVYDGLAESTLIGVLHSEKPFQDYRGQSIPAGFYTLRYALMPNDGNHLGVAPSRDFLLLIPVNADPGPEKSPKFAELVEASRKASGTKHPAPLSLVPAEGNNDLRKDGEGNVVFTTTVHITPGDGMGLALIVKGTAPQ